ncbi:hypothetical protein KY316_03275, partial [Candidatus Woesearchaeota archaeon]|nr:hypothetical protein [Candidatus Woesearchaeota archaeon]
SGMAGYIAKFFGIGSITAEYILSQFIVLGSAAVIFMLAKRLFKNNYLAVIAVLVFVIPNEMPVLKYRAMAYLLMMPLLFLLTYNFLNRQSWINAVWLGIVYGLIGLTHNLAFIAASFFLLFVFAYYVIIRNRKDKKYIGEIKKQLLPYAVVALIGMSIAMLWWFKPFFVYFGKTAPHYIEWNNQDWGNMMFQIKFVWETLRSSFFRFGSLRLVLLSIFSIFGVAGMIMIKDKEPDQNVSRNSFMKFIFVSSLIIIFHYIITQNILGFNFIPDIMSQVLLAPVLIILFVYGINFASYLLQKIKIRKEWFFAFIILLLVITQVTGYMQKIDSKWYKHGVEQEVYEHYTELEEFIVENTDVNDVILTTKETGFAINALTGRKLLTSRRAHNDPFIDMDPREMAQALILYGNNDTLRRELLNEYEVDYLYWDAFWPESEYVSDPNTKKITSPFDPLIIFYSEENEEILKQNGVKYSVQTTWVDPAIKGEYVKQFKLIFISPENYRSFSQPWDEALNKYITEVWNYEAKSTDGQSLKLAQLYKLEVD